MFDMQVVEIKTKNVENQANLITLNGSFSSGDSSYRLELKSNGTGFIIYSDFPDDNEEFDHQIDLGKLAQEIEEAVKWQIDLQSEQSALDLVDIEEIRRDTVSEMLEEVFWEQINQTLEDPFFRSSFFSDENWGEEFQTECGSTEEFIEFLKLSVLTEREIKDPEDFLIVEAETDFDTAGLIEGSYYTERLGELVEIACEYYKPTGFHYDYNDGCYDRMSGYSMSSETISVSLAEFMRVPSREKMLGMIKLRKKLTMMEVESEKLERLTSF